ncbi:uncharacterized protein LOC124939010 [Impatiens glandulifera]|uniref:uncharacterized protein LOC124939010 n=1 Tax=Impatiens glandulifera TaxID=253017 RepID=UPI001FB1755C|nr:uncharacterized protein LOC124939010 [Impatiens glandulifera]
MEYQRRDNNISGDNFSFPIIQIHAGGNRSEPEFEFGNAGNTPHSPKSPADHLFSNGKLLPHSFPAFQPSVGTQFAGIYGRNSSVSSRDSMTSSRSNSTSSNRSSTSVSARNSVSSTDSTEIRRSLRNDRKKMMMMRNDLDLFHNNNNNRCSQSQRWQFIAPMPAVGRQGSGRRKEDVAAATKATTKAAAATATEKQKVGMGKRILKSIVNACKDCHAMP